MPRAKVDPWRCKVRTKSTKKRCLGKAGDDGYCHIHRAQVGKPGPKTPEGKARIVAAGGPAHLASWKHGGYATRFMAEDEAAIAMEAHTVEGGLSAELAIARVQVMRIQRLIKARLDGTDTGDEVVQTVTDTHSVPGGPGQPPVVQQIHMSRTTARITIERLYQLLDRGLARVAALEATQASMRAQGATGDTQEQVEAFRRLSAEVHQQDLTPDEYARRFLGGNGNGNGSSNGNGHGNGHAGGNGNGASHE